MKLQTAGFVPFQTRLNVQWRTSILLCCVLIETRGFYFSLLTADVSACTGRGQTNDRAEGQRRASHRAPRPQTTPQFSPESGKGRLSFLQLWYFLLGSTAPEPRHGGGVRASVQNLLSSSALPRQGGGEARASDMQGGGLHCGAARGRHPQGLSVGGQRRRR